MSWLPIETAPKDGTLFVAYERGWCPWTNDTDVVYWNNGWWDSTDRETSMRPTHWMPLPTPPVDITE